MITRHLTIAEDAGSDGNASLQQLLALDERFERRLFCLVDRQHQCLETIVKRLVDAHLQLVEVCDELSA